MRTMGRQAILVLIAVSAAAGAAWGQVKSGLYGNLTLGVDGAAVTGVFSDYRVGNGTEDAPQFSCLFLLRGTVDGNAAKVTVWSPDNQGTTNGSLTMEKDTAKLSLEGNPPGCAAMGEEFVSKAYEEPSVMDGKWTSVRLVSAASADVVQAPVNGSSRKARLIKGEVVVIFRRIGGWLDGEDVNANRPVRGWVRDSDLAPDRP